MLVIITYDVSVRTEEGRKRLRQVAKICTNWGQRVQCSVFECIVDPAQWVRFRRELEDVIDPATDSLRYYHLGAGWRRKVEHIGAKPSVDPEGPLIV